MSIPGAENPRKVKNIVRPQIRRFRLLYARLLDELGQCESVNGGKTAAVADAQLSAHKGASETTPAAKTPAAEEKDMAIWRKLGLVDDIGMAEIRVSWRAPVADKDCHTFRGKQRRMLIFDNGRPGFIAFFLPLARSNQPRRLTEPTSSANSLVD